MSTAGRSRHRMMRTCSAFGGFVKSSAASAVAGASSGSITIGAALGLRRQAPMVSRMPVAARGLGWAALQPLLLAKRCCEPDTLSSRCTHAGIGLSGQVGGAPEIQRSYTGREILAPAALDAPRPASTSSNCRLSAASDTSTATNPSPQRSREAFQRNRGAAPWRDCLR